MRRSIAVLAEANIADDMEALIGGDLIAQIDAFWEVVEEDDGYRTACRTLYEENA